MAEAVLARLKECSPVRQRKAAAILGALVADAAATPLHWIYDQEQLQELAAKVGTPEFYPTSQSPIYNIETGRNGAYGDQLYVTLKSVAENKGLNPDDIADQFYRHFGPGTEYAAAREQAKESRSSSAVLGPWTNHNLSVFLGLREAGVKPSADEYSVDPDGVVRSVVAVALLSGKPEMLSGVDNCVKVTQSHTVAVGYALGAARILNHVIQTGSDGLDIAIGQLRDPNRPHPFPTDYPASLDIERAKAVSGKPHPQAVMEFGSACELPFSFCGMIHGIAAAKDYPSAIRNSILAGGDSGSRSSFIGACVAARGGLSSIPLEWILKLKRTEEILGYIEAVVQC